ALPNRSHWPLEWEETHPANRPRPPVTSTERCRPSSKKESHCPLPLSAPLFVTLRSLLRRSSFIVLSGDGAIPPRCGESPGRQRRVLFLPAPVICAKFLLRWAHPNRASSTHPVGKRPAPACLRARAVHRRRRKSTLPKPTPNPNHGWPSSPSSRQRAVGPIPAAAVFHGMGPKRRWAHRATTIPVPP